MKKAGQKKKRIKGAFTGFMRLKQEQTGAFAHLVWFIKAGVKAATQTAFKMHSKAKLKKHLVILNG